ncbi:MAG: hypothetical protein AO396_09590 [Candidatus Fermentibacter daniensis]|nr:MAG: hypothetical protein AO395_09530 [Candidatus Fermentibacter daniensis]KZD19160.1 MAG: hypothetical protein AO396_09590 [Candidatus Fermentibacter daniensis]
MSEISHETSTTLTDLASIRLRPALALDSLMTVYPVSDAILPTAADLSAFESTISTVPLPSVVTSPDLRSSQSQ